MARFTVVFEGDLAAIKGNPFKIESAFGKATVIANEDLAEEIEKLRHDLERYMEIASSESGD